MSATCDIDFENNARKIVYAGQLLRGTVRLNLLKKTDVLSVYIRINGKAYARWSHGKTTIVSEENYLDERIYLVGSNEAKCNISLEAGMHENTFEFMLPSDVPSSYEGEFGHIKYTIRVVMDFPRWIDKVFKEKFTLIKALNLNDFPSLRVITIAFFNRVETKVMIDIFAFCYSNQLLLMN